MQHSDPHCGGLVIYTPLKEPMILVGVKHMLLCGVPVLTVRHSKKKPDCSVREVSLTLFNSDFQGQMCRAGRVVSQSNTDVGRNFLSTDMR